MTEETQTWLKRGAWVVGGLVALRALFRRSTSTPSEPTTAPASSSNEGPRWEIPPEVRAKGEAQSVRYDAPPPWDGGKNCAGKFSEGARILGDFLRGNFSGVTQIGGYSCRQNTANSKETSVHGTGRAIDVHCKGADGDKIAAWLIEHAQEIGVQLVIWRRTVWNGSKRGWKDARYNGPDPHEDHVHVELNTDGANQRTPWFQGRA